MPTQEEKNKAIVRRYQEIYNTDIEALDEVLAPEAVTPAMLPPFPQGLEGAKQMHRIVVDAWADFQGTIEELIAEGDYVVARLTYSGTPVKEAFGVPPTGKSFKITGTFVARIQDGKIVEHFGVEDALGIMQQLGLMPA